MPRRLSLVLFFLLLAVVPLASARIISYAPYSDRVGVPALGLRLNRHFAAVEGDAQAIFSPITSNQSRGQLVLYDSAGLEEPRVILPAAGGGELNFTGVAVRQRPDEQPVIFATYNDVQSQKAVLSVDGGRTWKNVPLIGTPYWVNLAMVDVGGFYARSRFSPIRIGTPEFPFVVMTNAIGMFRLVAIGADGSVKELMSSAQAMTLAGSDIVRSRFLVHNGSTITMVDINGVQTMVGTAANASIEGWITPSGAAYIEQYRSAADISLWYYDKGAATFIAGTFDKTNPNLLPPPPPSGTQNPFFAVPTATYGGAWIISRAVGAPTKLLSHDLQRGLVEHWSDITAPEVEALHPSLGGDKVLIQVHRPRRASDQLLFKDPALAVWRVGQPAPRFYDELYLAEQLDKGFVHLDVDTLENGAPFVFDSGRGFSGGLITSPGGGAGGGGGDVVQEWGIVRASLAQRLVLPGFGRTPGAFGSLWRTDVTLINPNDVAVNVMLRYAASGSTLTASDSKSLRMTLAPREIRLVPDAAKELFGIESGVGALFINPEDRASINVTGRTYTQAGNGTYGYGMNAVDVYAAASARFPVTFAGAFQGSSYRTNLFMTDVSGRGASASFLAHGPYGNVETNVLATETSAFGVLQRNNLGFLLGMPLQAIGALTVAPTRGDAVVSLFSIDNRTNDATFFPPDLSAGATRVIPVIGHLEGANGSQFRSDLFLYNHSSITKFVAVEMRSWTNPNDFSFLTLTLLPHEARMIPDVLKTAFNRTGTARLRVTAQGAATDSSVRVTSRTYTVNPDGGTYGFIMPPLNSFQMATTGDTLEILGTALDRRFRTNIGLVDTAAGFNSITPRARIEVVASTGTVIDSFETPIPSLGGTQLNDVFQARGLTHDGSPVLIRITPLQGMIGAYAAMLDNETSDPTYFAANLAAK
jgi:hypothetical protein